MPKRYAKKRGSGGMRFKKGRGTTMARSSGGFGNSRADGMYKEKVKFVIDV